VRILVVNYEFPPFGGGGANASLFLSKALLGLGHEVTVMTASHQRWRGYSYEDNLHVYRLPSQRKLVDRSTVTEMIAFVLAGYRSLGRILKERQIDRAIIFFSIPSGLIGPYLRRIHGIPYVVSLRGADVPGYDHGLDTMHKLISPLRRSVLRYALRIVANSNGLAALSRAADPFPVHVIPNGVDTTIFQPPQNKAHATAFRILFVGRFHAQKNLVFFLTALSNVKQRTTRPLVITMVGDGPMKPLLVTHAEELGLSKHIVWLGWCEREKLKKVYQEVDCCVNPSLSEGMPNVVLEAMASGLPVIASDVVGNNELVIPGETGFLFELGNPQKLEDSLLMLIDNPETAERLGKGGRVFASRYSWQSVAQGYCMLLSGNSV
jgi:glycosyltransferase involved in cell wall biosynthesis